MTRQVTVASGCHDLAHRKCQMKGVQSWVSHYIDIQFVAHLELLPPQRRLPVQRV
jgi:hypothetical protein